MTVIAFQSKVLQSDGPWRAAELKALVESLAPESSRAGARRWDVGITEIGDPQFYLLGAPDEECILCISRLGRVYVLEDGAGKLLFEHNSLLALAEQARGVLQKKRRKSLRAPRSSGARFGKPLKKSWMQWSWKARNCWCTACLSLRPWHSPVFRTAAEPSGASYFSRNARRA
jgi:hypothetical protein